VDVHTPAKRSLNMSSVRCRGNFSTEQRFLSMLRSNRITGWRRGASVFGRPDFVFWRGKVAVFLDGCFWHGCTRGCRNIPVTNRQFWKAKIQTNQIRDRVVTKYLKAAGWTVLRIWEHAIRNDPKGVIRRLRNTLRLV
jgi:DNA mismatch endonuclease (patch repair protein)